MINQLQQPINYAGLAPQVDPGQKLLEGLKIGASISELRQQQAEREQVRMDKERYATDLQEALADGSQGAFLRLAAKHPQYGQVLTAASGQMGDAAKLQFDVDKANREQQTKAAFQQTMAVSNALENGNVPFARTLLTQYRDAAEGSSQPETVAQMNQMIGLIDNGNARDVQSVANMLAMSLDPDGYKKMVEARQKEQETEYNLRNKNITQDLSTWMRLKGLPQDTDITPEQMAEYNEWLRKMKESGASRVSVSVDSAQKGMGELGKKQIEALPELVTNINNNREMVEKTYDILTRVLPSVLTGPFANARGRIETFFSEKQPERAALRSELETFRNHLKLDAARTWLKGQGSVTQAERDLIAKFVAGGDDFTAQEYRTLFDVQQRMRYSDLRQQTNAGNATYRYATTSKNANPDDVRYVTELFGGDFGNDDLPNIKQNKDGSFRVDIPGAKGSFPTFSDAVAAVLGARDSGAIMSPAAPTAPAAPAATRPTAAPAPAATTKTRVINATEKSIFIDGKEYPRPVNMDEKHLRDYIRFLEQQGK
jgi:hypothetical protein